MRKSANPNDEYRIKPTKKIELSEKHIKLRLVLFIISAISAMFFIIFGIVQCSSVDSGFLRVRSNFDLYDQDFILYYNVGTKNSPNDDHKNVIALYDQGICYAYPLFDSSKDYEGVINMKYINDHPNEEIEVSPTLYKAFETLEKYNTRLLYQAPISTLYLSMVASKDEATEYSYDPSNLEVLDWINSYLAFTNDDNKIHLYLKENNKVELFVSDEYMNFTLDSCNPYIDFSYLKNAFIMDSVVDTITSQGYTRGYISSVDGYFRAFSSEDSFNYSIADLVENTKISAASFSMASKVRGIIYTKLDLYPTARPRYYTLADGTVRSYYIDENDGISKHATTTMMCYSDSLSLAEIVLKTNGYYITNEVDQAGLSSLKDSIKTIYVLNQKVYYNDNITLKNLFHYQDITYEGVKF